MKENTCKDPTNLPESKHLVNVSSITTFPLTPLVSYRELKCKYVTGSQISTMDSWIFKVFKANYKPSSLGLKKWKKLYSRGSETSELGLKTQAVF